MVILTRCSNRVWPSFSGLLTISKELAQARLLHLIGPPAHAHVLLGVCHGSYWSRTRRMVCLFIVAS